MGAAGGGVAAVSDAQPFHTTEGAWRWAWGILQSRRDGAGAQTGIGRSKRPCEADDVVQVIDRLYREHRIGLPHARVLRVYAERDVRPDPGTPDDRLWGAALSAMEPVLRAKGIVA